MKRRPFPHSLLLDWFDDHLRDLPWRKRRTPYRIWVSEIMLQQTQVATVIDYYKRFMKAFPSVNRLAAAEQEEVLKLWEGLGYYRRARQLHKAAQVVVEEHGGTFPTRFDEVLALPGIGRYTAGAILSISQDQRLPILEGNTIRLFARLLEMRADPRTGANQKALWAYSEEILPKERCGDFNQALMELGAKVCRPKNPECTSCPLQDICPTFARGLQLEIPHLPKKIKYEKVNEGVVVLQRRNKFLVRMCGEGERWTGLWDFPRFQLAKKNCEAALESDLHRLTGLNANLFPVGQTIKHAVTKYRITLDCFVGKQISGRLKKDPSLCWKTRDELAEIPMSITGRKIAERLSEILESRLF